MKHEQNTAPLKIAFVGGGNMATALIGGLANTLTPGANLHVIDLSPETLQSLHQRFGVSTAQKIDATLAGCDVIVLAVKPQQIGDLVADLLPQVSTQLILSVMAGIRMQDLSRWLNGHQAIVRTMPNTPALIGQGITGMVAMAGVSAAQRQAADAIMRAVGSTVWVDDESRIDAVTALSGSGPAYVFYFIEAMQQAAQEMGLRAEQGRQLAIATFVGAGQLAAQSDEPVSLLRERVTSKGGTTAAALSVMAERDLPGVIATALEAARTRSAEMGEEFGRTG